MSLEQGVHNIDEAFESSKHPGLIIHDSMGFAGGTGDEELKQVRNFVQKRTSRKTKPADRLHVIWWVLESSWRGHCTNNSTGSAFNLMWNALTKPTKQFFKP